MKAKLLLLGILLSASTVYIDAQVININPDPNEDPWLTGGVPEVNLESQTEVDQIPTMIRRSFVDPPDLIDNSHNIFMRPIFHQKHGSCAQASGIGYVYTYEINWKRDLPANDTNHISNWYPTHYTYNFLNDGDGLIGSYVWQGWNIIKETGCPNVPTYGGMCVNNDPTYWMTGYDKYKSALNNSLKQDTSYEKILFDTDPELGLTLIKQWIYDHNAEEEIGGLISFSTKMQGCNIVNIPSGLPETGKSIIIEWSDTATDSHQMTFVGFNDSICFDYNGDNLYTNNIDINGDSIIDMQDWEWGALKVANSWGNSWPQPIDSGYVYFPYKLLAQDTCKVLDFAAAFVVHVVDEYEPELVFKIKMNHPKRGRLRIGIDYGINADSGHSYLPDTLYYIFDLNGGNFPLLGDGNNDPLEIILDYNYFYSEDDVGKLFLCIRDNSPQSLDGHLHSLSLIDYRWNETFELNSGYMYEPIYNTYNWFHIDYDLIPHEAPITSNLNLFSNMVSRFEPTVTNTSTLTIEDSVKVDFYTSDLIIDTCSTLIIEDDAVLTGKRGTSRIVIYGLLQLGNNVTFAAEGDAELILDFVYDNRTYTVSNAVFDGSMIHSVCDSLRVTNCVFTDANIEKSGGSMLVSQCDFEDSFVYAYEGQDEKIIEISDCDFNNPEVSNSPIFIDSYSNYSIHDDTIAYNYGSGICLYNAGGIEGVDVFTIVDNEIYPSGSKRGSMKDLGIKIYNSKAHILNGNYIHDNDYGISILDYSQTKIRGNNDEGCDELPQKIINNIEHQVYITRASFPVDFNYNRIYEETFNTYFIYQESEYQIPTQCNVEYNYWGEGVSNPSSYLYTSMTPDWDPICTPLQSKTNTAGTLYDSAVNYVVSGDYQSAESRFKEIVEEHSGSNYSYASVNQLFELKKIYDQDYSGLQLYLDTTSILQDTNDLGRLADIVSNKCDIELENYQDAIDFFENVILTSGSYQDSLFAIIDLGYVYLRMNNGNSRPGFECRLPQYIPKSRESYEVERDRLIDLLFDHHRVTSIEEEDVGSENKGIISHVTLYPNPASVNVSIDFRLESSLHLGFVIYDQTGRITKEVTPGLFVKGANTLRLDLEGLESGVYYLSIRHTDRPIANKKIILID